MAKTEQIDVQSLARVGAAMRLAELEREMAALRRMFPGLKALSADAVDVPGWQAGDDEKLAKSAAKKSARRGRQTPMTEEERQAVSDRMKNYWAAKQTEKQAKSEKQAEE